MKKFAILVLASLAMTGCRDTTNAADIRVAAKAADSMNSVAPAPLPGPPEIKVVTGVPATTVEDQKAQTEALAGKDKPGAVAVKTEF